MNRWPVTIQPHVRYRMRERCPGVKPARAADDVREALAAGRVSAERPEWLLRRQKRHPNAAISLYAWTAGRERVYVLRATDDEFLVMSVLT